jgi:PASTA domain
MPDLYQLPTEQPLRPRRHAAARSQLERCATSWRERLGRRWHHLGIVLGLGIGLSVAGGATAGTIYLTKGPVPSAHGQPDFQRAPAFVEVDANTKVGYVPRKYVVPSAPNTPVNRLLNAIAPVYSPNLKTLIGHLYPGIGFIPLGLNPHSVPCLPIVENGTTSTIPCRSTTKTVPDIVGMDTPDGMAILLTGGMLVISANAHSRSVPVGHIISTSPAPGSKFPASTPVTVVNSIGP